MLINGKEYDLDKMFKKINIYCNEYDVLCTYNVSNKTVRLIISKKLNETLKTLKININDVELKLTNKLVYKYGYFPEYHSFTNNIYITNPFLADCVNEIIDEIIKANNKILEIE